MHCKACVGRVENALNKIDGIKGVKVNLKKESAEINYTTPDINFSEISNVLEDAGYTAEQA